VVGRAEAWVFPIEENQRALPLERCVTIERAPLIAFTWTSEYLNTTDLPKSRIG
jgi:hypothetical protein